MPVWSVIHSFHLECYQDNYIYLIRTESHLAILLVFFEGAIKLVSFCRGIWSLLIVLQLLSDFCTKGCM